jgi:hypothetical protein
MEAFMLGHKNSHEIKPGDMVECRKYGQLIIQLLILSMAEDREDKDRDKLFCYIQYADKTCNIRHGDDFSFPRDYFDRWNSDNNGCEWVCRSV